MGEEVYTYAYDIENRLKAVREGGALLMAASYDGDGNRTFQITRQKIPTQIYDSKSGENPANLTCADLGTIQPLEEVASAEQSTENRQDNSSLPDAMGGKQEEVRTYYEKVYEDPADSIFWYGFGQGMVQLSGGGNTALSANMSDDFSRAWSEKTGKYDLVLHSEAVYTQEDMDAMLAAGLSEKEIAEITGNKQDIRGHEEKVPEQSAQPAGQKVENSPLKPSEQPIYDNGVVIPSNPNQTTRIDYELTYYVNDINTANAQVMMTYGRNDSEKAVYTYGNGRIAEDNLQTGTLSDYVYDGRGSVVQTMVDTEVDLSLTYDPFGSITSGADENFVGFAYNGEESNQVTGLQYLRARYYNTELGSFLTMDSYLGSLTDVTSQNRYTYANNNPVNNIDPSGHYSVNVNGAMQYYQSTGLNELRDYMTSAALWAGQVNAQNGFNRSIATAQNTSMFRYKSITGISQATANRYIVEGIAKAGQVSMNYGCSVPTLGNQVVAKFANNVNAAKNTANRQISNIKANKKAQYDAYVAYQAWLAQQRRLAEQAAAQRVLGASLSKLLGALTGALAGINGFSYFQKYNKMMQDVYGFDSYQASLISKAYYSVISKTDYQGNVKKKIHAFSSMLASLEMSYNATRWRLTAGTGTPTMIQEILMFNGGFTSQEAFDLFTAINTQHRMDDSPYNDFAHEMIALAISSNEDSTGIGRTLVDIFNGSFETGRVYTNYEGSFKGDIDSGRADDRDLISDIDVTNYYHLMKNSNGDIFNEFMNYHYDIQSGKKNRGEEFFKSLGDGDVGIGMYEFFDILTAETSGSDYIIKGNDENKMAKARKRFLELIFSEYDRR